MIVITKKKKNQSVLVSVDKLKTPQQIEIQTMHVSTFRFQERLHIRITKAYTWDLYFN